MNKVEVFEHDGVFYRTKNEAILAEIEGLTNKMTHYYSFIFDKVKTYDNREKLIELLGELE